MLLFLFPGSTKTTAVSISKLLRERVPLEELVARCFGLVESRRADSTAVLLITSERSNVSGCCMGLPIPLI